MKPTTEDVMKWAREADFNIALDAEDDLPAAWHSFATPQLEYFAALAYAAGAAAAQEKWKEAVIDELVCAHIYNAEHENNPKKAVQDAISWNVEVALDPRVSSAAAELIAAEREAIADAVSECDQRATPKGIAAAIRARKD